MLNFWLKICHMLSSLVIQRYLVHQYLDVFKALVPSSAQTLCKCVPNALWDFLNCLFWLLNAMDWSIGHFYEGYNCCCCADAMLIPD